MRSIVILWLLSASGTGCITIVDIDTRAHAAVTQRATIDLECTAVEASRVGKRRVEQRGELKSKVHSRYHATGCGKEASYVVECTSDFHAESDRCTATPGGSAPAAG